MGEYGFITGDGVYHVTVYATDENGNFIILKTRNIRIGLHTPPPTTTTTTRRPEVSILNGLRGCSGCLIPEKSNEPPREKEPNLSGPHTSGFGPPIGVRGNTQLAGGFKDQGTPGVGGTKDPQLNVPGNFNVPHKNVPLTPKQAGASREPSGYKVSNDGEQNRLPNVDSLTNRRTNNKNSNAPSNLGSVLSNKANVGTKSMSEIDSLHLRTPGTTPNKILTNTEMKILDFMSRLYKFNYTLTFHGHEEEGDVEGNKKGSYFNNGRDGNQRKVVYLANEFGYQPVVTLESLDAVDTPNENTEKELTQLKGSEFIWFYNKIKENGLK